MPSPCLKYHVTLFFPFSQFSTTVRAESHEEALEAARGLAGGFGKSLPESCAPTVKEVSDA